MRKADKITYCPCGRVSVGLRQGVQCCAKCEELEKDYWSQGSGATSRLHGVSMRDVDVEARKKELQS